MSELLPINTDYLMTVDAELDEPLEVGSRRIFNVTSGSVKGPRVSGRVLPGGGDWLTVRSDGSMVLDVRTVIETDDGELLYTIYPGRLIMAPEMFTMDKSDRAKVDPSSYYFRVMPTYETASKKYSWLNNIVSVGVGRLTDKGVSYSIYEVK
jgi:hypothetical protein